MRRLHCHPCACFRSSSHLLHFKIMENVSCAATIHKSTKTAKYHENYTYIDNTMYIYIYTHILSNTGRSHESFRQFNPWVALLHHPGRSDGKIFRWLSGVAVIRKNSKTRNRCHGVSKYVYIYICIYVCIYICVYIYI